VDSASEQTHQPYTYTTVNPLNASDPTGRCGFGSLGEAAESFNPLSSENWAYEGTKALIGALGGNASKIAEVTGSAAGLLALTPAAPLAAPLAAVSAAASAYAAGEGAGRGETLAAALNGLASALGGAAAAERVLGSLESLIPTLGGKSAVEQTGALAETLDKLGYSALAASILNSLTAHNEGNGSATNKC
jgi:hypothetical protein